MGTMRHHAILVTTFREDYITAAHEMATTIFGDAVSSVYTDENNGYSTFAIFPDGSKEGWMASDIGDRNRAMFLAWFRTQQYNQGREDDDDEGDGESSPYDWVEVQYGSDNGDTHIVHDSDEWKRKR